MKRVHRAALVAVALAAIGSAGCTEVGTDPRSVVSILGDTTLVVSVIAGDTLRDTTGAPLSLTRLGRAFNGRGDELPMPRVDILLTTFDSAGLVTLPARVVYGTDSTPYLVAGAGPVSSSAKVAVNLQYSRTLRVVHRFEIVPRADLIVADRTSSSQLTFSDLTTRSGVGVVGVRLSYDSAGIRRPVRATLVKFTIESAPSGAARIDSVRFVESAGRDSLRLGPSVRFDTTDVTGLATRSLTVYRKSTTHVSNGRDTILVRAKVYADRPSATTLSLLLPLIVLDSVRTTTAYRATRGPVVLRP